MDTPSKAQEKQKQLREMLLQTSIPDNFRINLVNNEGDFTQKVEQELEKQDDTKKNKEKITLKKLTFFKKEGNTPKRNSVITNELQDQSQDNKINALKRFRKAALGIQFANAIVLDRKVQGKTGIEKDTIDIKDPKDCELVINILKKKQRSKKEFAFVKKAIQNLNFFETKKQELDQKLYDQLFDELKYEFFKNEEAIFHYGSCSLLVPKYGDELDSNNQLKNTPQEFQRLKELFEQYKSGITQITSPQLKPINLSYLSSPQQIPRVIKSIPEFQEGDLALNPNDLPQPSHQKQQFQIQMFPLIKKSLNAKFQIKQSFNMILEENINSNLKKIVNISENRSNIGNELNHSNSNYLDLQKSQQISPNQKFLSSQTIHKFDFSMYSQQNDAFTNFIHFCLPDFSVTCEYQQGDSFGDVALLTRSKQQGTVICKEDTHIMSLSKESFDRILGEQQKQIIKQKIKFLKQFSFFGNIPDTALMNLINCLKFVSYKKNDLVFKELDDSQYLYFIMNGEIELSQMVEVNEDQKEEPIPSFNDESSINKYKFPSLNHVKQEKLKQKTLRRIKFALLGANNCFGEKEIIQNCQRTQMAKCISQQVDINMIKKDSYCLNKKQSKMLITYLKLYDSTKKFEEFNNQKERERQKRIEQVIKVSNQIKKIQQREYQKLDFKTKSLKSHNPSLHDLISPKSSIHDISQIEGTHSVGNSMILNNLRNKLYISPPPEKIEERESNKSQPYFRLIDQPNNSQIAPPQNRSLHSPSPEMMLKELSKQKLFEQIKMISKKKRKVYNQLKNVQSSVSLDHNIQQLTEEQPKHHKAKKKIEKLEIIFDYFFEQTPILNKLFALKDPPKRKPLLSQSLESNSRITNKIIDSITHRGDQTISTQRNKSMLEDYIIPTFADQVITSRKDLAQSSTLNNYTHINSISTIQNEGPTITSRKEILPILNKGIEDQLPKLKVLVYGDENTSLIADSTKIYSSQALKQQPVYLNNPKTQRNQARSLSKEKNIHVEKQKKQGKDKNLSQRSFQDIIQQKDSLLPNELNSQENLSSSRAHSFSKQIQNNQPSFLSARNSIGIERKIIPSIFSTPLPLPKSPAHIQEFNFPSAIQSPISAFNNVNGSFSAKGFVSLKKLNKKK